MKKKQFLSISVFGYEDFLCIKKCCEDKHANLLLIEEKGKRHYVSSNILIRSHIIILYIAEENYFVVIVYKLSVQKKYKKFILKAVLKFMASKGL